MFNINIKANVNNITYTDIFIILKTQHANIKPDKDVYITYKGYNFHIKVEINLSINYIITEIKQETPIT